MNVSKIIKKYLVCKLRYIHIIHIIDELINMILKELYTLKISDPEAWNYLLKNKIKYSLLFWITTLHWCLHHIKCIHNDYDEQPVCWARTCFGIIIIISRLKIFSCEQERIHLRCFFHGKKALIYTNIGPYYIDITVNKQLNSEYIEKYYMSTVCLLNITIVRMLIMHASWPAIV